MKASVLLVAGIMAAALCNTGKAQAWNHHDGFHGGFVFRGSPHRPFFAPRHFFHSRRLLLHRRVIVRRPVIVQPPVILPPPLIVPRVIVVPPPRVFPPESLSFGEARAGLGP